MALNTKKFNGVITYSDYALSSQNNADNVSKRDSFSNLATTTNIESGGGVPLVVNGNQDSQQTENRANKIDGAGGAAD